MSDKIRIFTSPLCPPCQELKEKLTPEQLRSVEFINIHTSRGFDEAMAKKILGVPYAEKNGKRCRIIDDDGKIRLDCEE